MSEYWNERTKNISPYVPGEQPRDRQFVKLNTNENPYPPSPKVIEAIKNAANKNLRLYPDPECTQFREAVAARYGVKPQQVFAGNGSDEILGFAFGAFFESKTVCCSSCCATRCADCDGSKKPAPILFPDITYSFYPVYADLWNIPFKTIPLCEDFTINTDEYKINCGGVILPNPNAPTSIALESDKLLELAKYLEPLNKVLIIDEAYIAFSSAKNAQSVISFIDKHPNLLVVHTLSKSYSLAGLRAGFAISNEKLIEALCRIRDSFNSYTLDRLALAGAAAAIADKQYYDEINTKVIAARERTVKELKNLGIDVLPSSANFVFIKAPNLKGEDFFLKLREKGILVRHFKNAKIADYLRICIGTDEEMDIVLAACREIIGRG
ncbi:MAG: aminotransferase class I/II-fold pyridoxal phosphate-dependent enzyme [Treponema sp.]|nr:aminotransferase class I/II-fold pyridoxal phosphate-dependent enzyme [Treponema sp.]